MIANDSFYDFVVHIIKKHNDEKDTQQLWEFYLSRVYDKSFNEWVQEIKSESKKEDATKTKDAIIQDSQNILKGFIPQ